MKSLNQVLAAASPNRAGAVEFRPEPTSELASGTNLAGTFLDLAPIYSPRKASRGQSCPNI